MHDQRKMERRAVQGFFYNPPEERRRSGYDRRGEYRPSQAPGAIRPAFNEGITRDRRSRPESGTE